MCTLTFDFREKTDNGKDLLLLCYFRSKSIVDSDRTLSELEYETLTVLELATRASIYFWRNIAVALKYKSLCPLHAPLTICQFSFR